MTGERWLTVDLEDECAEVEDADAAVMKREGHRVVLRYDPARISTAALISRITANHAVSDLFVQNPPIEEIIARIYGERET